MPEANQTLLQHFKTKRLEKNSVAQQEARRLVNLYRSLSCFGDDFLNQYNQMLLDAKPSVRRLLSTFTGGDEVEDYLEFLLENSHLSRDDFEKASEQDSTQIKGYLPTPSMDLVTNQAADTITISKKEWENIKSREESLLKQIETLSKTQKMPKASTSDFDGYSEIIEEGQNNE